MLCQVLDTNVFYILDLDNLFDEVSGTEPLKTLQAVVPTSSTLYSLTLDADVCITCHTTAMTQSGKQVFAAISRMGPGAAPDIEHQAIAPLYDMTDMASGTTLTMVTKYFPKDRLYCWVMANSDQSLTVGSWRVNTDGLSYSFSVMSEVQILPKPSLDLPPLNLQQLTTLISAEDPVPMFLRANRNTYLLWAPDPRVLFVFFQSHIRSNKFISIAGQSAITKGMIRAGMVVFQTDTNTCSLYTARVVNSTTGKRRYRISKVKLIP